MLTMAKKKKREKMAWRWIEMKVRERE